MSDSKTYKHCEVVSNIDVLPISLEEVETICKEKKSIKQWAFIIHDQCEYTVEDKKEWEKNNPPEKPFPHEIGEKKKPHIHLYLNFGRGSKTFVEVAKWFNLAPQFVGKIHSTKKGILEYLTHANSPKKHQYDLSDVVCNFDVAQAIEEAKEENDIYKEMREILFDFTSDKISYATAQVKMRDIRVKIKSEEMLSQWTKKLSEIRAVWKQFCEVAHKSERDLQVVFIHGVSGAGKSTFAKYYVQKLIEKGVVCDYFRTSSSNDIMDGYMGEHVLICDDMRDVDEEGDMIWELPDMLKFLDPYHNSSFKSRYNNKTFMGKLIIITSTKDPLAWFSGTKEQRWQFFRRISSYIHIDRDFVSEYSEILSDQGIDYACGFSPKFSPFSDAVFVEKAKLKGRFENPIPGYLASLPKKDRFSFSVSDDVTLFEAEIKKSIDIKKEEIPY